MKIVSTNIGKQRTVRWGHEDITTGIFKFPTEVPIHLGSEDVVGDQVIDRKYHGGIDKACYAYSADFYNEWHEMYPNLDWQYGMFGENITIEGLDEMQLHIGDTFTVGSAILQISEPRQPCVKLNVRFDSNQAVKDFLKFGRSGCYFRVLQEGEITVGDTFELIKSYPNSLTVYDVFQLIYAKNRDTTQLEAALKDPFLAEATKEKFRS